jgi:rod shape-determining protein MreB
MMTIREIKEQNAFVGNVESPVMVGVLMGGKMRTVDLTEQIRSACEELLKQTFEATKVLIARGSSDSVGELLQNIILTGGGSRIRGFNTELQRLLTEEGYESPRVHLAGDEYKQFVAKGALRAARQTKESQWKKCMS